MIDDLVTISTTATRGRIPENLDAACSSIAIIGPGICFMRLSTENGLAVQKILLTR